MSELRKNRRRPRPRQATPAPIQGMNSSLCPLCGSENLCGMALASGKCWCEDVNFTPELLARVPETARDKACICQRCAVAATGGDGGRGKAPSQ